jgi:hypothetical protein
VLKRENYRYTVEFSDWVKWLHTVYGYTGFYAVENFSTDFRVVYDT